VLPDGLFDAFLSALEVAVSHGRIEVKRSIFDVLIEFEVGRAGVDSLPGCSSA
jgi:hypothetical protein